MNEFTPAKSTRPQTAPPQQEYAAGDLQCPSLTLPPSLGTLTAYDGPSPAPSLLGELIYEYDGALEHFDGDGLMVFFNDPIPCPDPEARAVKMAVAMRARIATLSVSWRARGHQFGFGIGIYAGSATMGRIGFEERYDYAAIGTVTITASRLTGAALDGQILITRSVLDQIETQVDVERLPDLNLKGFRQPVPAFNVLAVR